MSPEQHTGPARRIADALRADITEGRLPPGMKLPAVRDLAEQYGVSRNTAAKAVTILLNEGFVTTRYGSGTYVRAAYPIRRLGPERYARSRWAVTTVVVGDGRQTASREAQGDQTQTVDLIEADEETAAALDIAAGDPVYRRARVITRDGQPTHTMASHYRQADVEGTPLTDPSPGIAGPGGGFWRLAEQGLAPHTVTEDLRARMPSKEEMALLGIGAGEPVVELRRVMRTEDGRPVEYAIGVHVASRFVWSYTFDIPD